MALRYSAVLVGLFLLSNPQIGAADYVSLDVGKALAGTTTKVSENGWDIEGSGTDIWNSADSFRFVYQEFIGDLDIRARICSVSNTNPWAKAGVMIRQNSAANSTFAMMVATPGNGLSFQRRVSQGGSCSHTAGGVANYPNAWVRLVRNGSKITSYKALDAGGQIWVEVGSVEIAMTESILVGICVTAHDATLLSKAEVRDVLLQNYTAPQSGSGTGLAAAYYNNLDVIGQPALSRVDSSIVFSWGSGAPASEVQADRFSVRWVGMVQMQYSEDYTFYTRSDDGVRLWVDGKLLVDKWVNQGVTEYASTPIPFTAGKKVSIKMEYYEQTGDAVAQLIWSSPSTAKSAIPQKQLYPESGFVARVKYHSVTSPACIEGRAWVVDGSANTVELTTPFATNTATFISEEAWFANVPLSPSPTPTDIEVKQTNNGVSQKASILWQVTDLTKNNGSANTITIRKGDALLLTATGAGTTLKIDADGNGKVDFTGAPGETLPFTFTNPGTFSATASIDGNASGSLTIIVVEVSELKKVACEIGYERLHDVANQEYRTILPAGVLPSLYFSSSDESHLSAFAAITADNKTILHIKPLKNSRQCVVVRLGGDAGPIAATISVQEFNLTTDAGKFIGVQEHFSDGSLLVETNLVMIPKVSDLNVKLNIFVSGVTFDDSTLTKTKNTNEFVLNTETGMWQYPYRMIMQPNIKTGACHTIAVYQGSEKVGN